MNSASTLIVSVSQFWGLRHQAQQPRRAAAAVGLPGLAPLLLILIRGGVGVVNTSLAAMLTGMGSTSGLLHSRNSVTCQLVVSQAEHACSGT
jgi:hypothetical protein